MTRKGCFFNTGPQEEETNFPPHTVHQSLVCLASQGKKVAFMRVPDHTGIASNEQADTHASQVSHQPCTVPAADALKMAHQVIYHTWWSW